MKDIAFLVQRGTVSLPALKLVVERRKPAPWSLA